MDKRFLYSFEYSDSNFRRVFLTPSAIFVGIEKQLREIEGFFISEKEVEAQDREFSITQEDKIAAKYNGFYLRFRDYY